MNIVFRSLILGAGLLGSSAAMAGATGNAAAVTEYLFRGVEQSGGAAIQGGLDYSTSVGFYAGAWVSNIAPLNTTATGFGSYETDLYAGFGTKVGDVGIDAGLLYYYYRDATQFNTLEAYVGASFGPASVKAYYTPEYFGSTLTAIGGAALDDKLDGIYLTASAVLPLSNSLTLTPQVGFSSGDGPGCLVVGAIDTSRNGPDSTACTTDDIAANEDGYLDYSLTLTKSLDNGFSFSFAAVGTDIKTDNEKVVLGLKKTFDL